MLTVEHPPLTLSAALVAALLPLASARPAASRAPAEYETPAAVADLLYARPFTLEQAFRYHWYRDMPEVSTGWLVVLDVDPVLIQPRQTAQPVLYAGSHMAQPVGQSWPHHLVIAIVPGELDLERDPIWFGTPGLPERVTTDDLRRERALAEAKGMVPFDEATRRRALEAGGEPLTRANFAALSEAAYQLFLSYVPEEPAAK